MPPKKTPSSPNTAKTAPATDASKQKATKEQLREQKAAAEAAERQRLFGNWTGATPEDLLLTQCSRMIWNRPVFN
ncbi:hypothetical protein HDU99_010439, partial [Rhizoclosmatium hyalinum]